MRIHKLNCACGETPPPPPPVQPHLDRARAKVHLQFPVMALTTAAPATAKAMHHQLIKGERHLFSSSDDNAVIKQIQATHSPDGCEVDVRPLLHIVEDVLKLAKPTVVVSPQQAVHMEEMTDDKFHHAGIVGTLEALAFTIHRVSCEISYKCTTTGGGDAHATTLGVLHLLSNYTWDSKVVLALAGFAVGYGEFWLTAQLHTVDPLAKSIALLKQLPDILENTAALRPRFDALNNLIGVMLGVTECIIEFKELPSEYITPADTPDMSMAMAHIPTAVYWIIRSLVACASQIIALVGLGNEYISSTTEAWELSSLAHKLNNIHGHLTKQLNLLHQYIDDKKHIEAYNALVRLFETIHLDNYKILRALLYSKDDLPLIDGTTKKHVSVDALRRKIVILFITDLEVSRDELYILNQLYHDTHQSKLERQYEIVWLPLVDRHNPWTPAREEAFKNLSAMMTWYVVTHPLHVDAATIKYIREFWGFDKKTMLVVLDPQGKVVCPNALHMMWIWGTIAFPFTSNREEALWKEETWRLEFLIDEIDPNVFEWLHAGHYVCLYGGESIEWIRRLTTTLQRVVKEANIPLETLYVGKSGPRERVRKATNVIKKENLSSFWEDPTMTWFFWTRLESMWHSKRQSGWKMEDDPIMHEVTTLLSYDGGEEGWAIIFHGSLDHVRANGRMMLDCLLQFDKWKANVEAEGFLPALAMALQPFHTPEHCTRLILPGDTGEFQQGPVVCAECNKPMEKCVLYRCCNN